MENNQLETPVLFLIFNRPDTTRQAFETIKLAKPKHLYIASDGARENCPGEAEKVQAVRDYVIDQVNWDCEIKTLFRKTNLGCGPGIKQAIDWFFEHEDR